jgi:histidyl-tRNA synthetase
MTDKFQTPRGTRDFLPEEMSRRRKVGEGMRRVFERYGYGEICTPAFEDFELLAKKSGPEIEEEIYAFKDKSGRKLGLRFDPTVPICRIVAANPSMPKPIRFYYITNMWRYDRPGAGRWREFWQAGVELIGSGRPEADAEMLAIVSDSLKAVGFGVGNFSFKINSRSIIELFVKKAGVPEGKKFDAFRAMDKLDKIGEDAVIKEMKSYKIPDRAARKLIELIKSKKTGGKEMKELEAIKALAEKMGARDVSIDFSIVRGIDYYTGFIFETFVKGSESLGSVASGGRYDTLIGLYGGGETPATGFGIGIDRLMETMKDNKKFIPVDVYVASASDSVRDDVIKITQQLRDSDIKTGMDVSGKNLKRQLEYANAVKVPYVVIVGEKELKKGKLVLKDMAKKTQKELGLKELIRRLK